ncbi:alpha/beta hydrolase [Nonomuraea sp. NPDC050556]|uniref:alpha/beta hydrolase n=1 Tax=Nonomuraea sp. NPDC050556 TaxID=3364369 RepID=UPI00379128F2
MSRVVRRAPSLGGLAGAVVFFCLALSPSLVPRHWLLQGVVAGVTAAIGYGVAALLSAWAGPVLTPRGRGIAWRVLAVAGAALCAVALLASAGWQRDIRRLMGMDTDVEWHLPLIVIVAVVTFALLLLLARSMRLGTRKLIGLLERFVPRWAAVAAGLVVAALLTLLFVNDFLYSRFLGLMNETAALTDRGTSEGITRPASDLLSGGPGSLMDWDGLGSKGRDFVGSALTPAAIGAFAGRPALAPIRVYAGLRSAGSFEEQARLAVRELERTGAFDRSVLAIMGTTGTGWVNENVADALEYLRGGDTAMVAMQYSYLPSWVSFLVDRTKAAQAGTALVHAVHARWAALPAGDRPKLVLFGESLGSYAAEAAFTDVTDVLATVDGALLVGPPNMNPIWSALTARRDPGSPMWRPVYNGGADVCFAQFPADLARPGCRVVYLQNASDPITWWNPQLLYRRPGWLDDPYGPDVTPAMRWFPVVTFWQVVVDLMFSDDVPPGHGHRFGSNVVDGWVAIIPPPGWTRDDTARLKHIIDARH